MKLLTTFLLALVGLATFASAGYKELCSLKRPEVYKAINAFCPKRDIVIPSNYGNNGKQAGGRAKVWIKGMALNGCNPPQWVPYGICYSQFYRMCSDHVNAKWFGNRLCQEWRINYNDKWIDGKGKLWQTFPKPF